MKFDLTKAAQIAVILLAFVFTIAAAIIAFSAFTAPASPPFAQAPPLPHERKGYELLDERKKGYGKKGYALPHERKGYELLDERKKGYGKKGYALLPHERGGSIPLREQQGYQPPPPPHEQQGYQPPPPQ